MYSDIGISEQVELWLDSTAAIGTVGKTGLGKAKHIQIQDLWLQNSIKDGRVVAKKVHTSDNPADVFTKALDFLRIEYLCSVLGYTLIQAVD